MKGVKTFVVGGIMTVAGIAVCFFPIPTHILLGSLGALVGIGLITLRLGIKSVDRFIGELVGERIEDVIRAINEKKIGFYRKDK